VLAGSRELRLHVRRQQLRSAAHAARCTARHGVEATPNAAGANIACAMNVARHSPAAMWLSENRSPPYRSTPPTPRPSP